MPSECFRKIEAIRVIDVKENNILFNFLNDEQL